MCWSRPRTRNSNVPIKLLSPQICIRNRAPYKERWFAKGKVSNGQRSPQIVGCDYVSCSPPYSILIMTGRAEDTVFDMRHEIQSTLSLVVSEVLSLTKNEVFQKRIIFNFMKSREK